MTCPLTHFFKAILQFGNSLLPNYAARHWLDFTTLRDKIAGQLIPYLCNDLLHNSPGSMKPSEF